VASLGVVNDPLSAPVINDVLLRLVSAEEVVAVGVEAALVQDRAESLAIQRADKLDDHAIVADARHPRATVARCALGSPLLAVPVWPHGVPSSARCR
jgi:hypothetical protein